MKVSFKAFENTGIGVDINNENKVKTNGISYRYIVPPYVHLTLNTKLNNINSSDLDDFSFILKKYPNRNEPNSINFHYDKFFSNVNKRYKKEFWLNDRPLLLKDENLSVFTKLAQLLNRLSNASNNDFSLESDYLSGVDAKFNFAYFANNQESTEMFSKNLVRFHSPVNVRLNAQKMSEELTAVMLEYFA